MEDIGQPIAKGRTAQIYPWKDGRVVKLYFEWMNPNEADFEARINADIHAAGLPAPGGVEVVEVNGRKGVLFERVVGPTLLQAIAAKPWRIGYYADMLGELQSELHKVSLDWLRDVRGLFYWAIEHAPERLPDEQHALIIEQLGKMPESNGVCHGDFHPDNVILSARGPVIIDWVNSCRGLPGADVARTLMMLQIGKPVEKLNPLMEYARRVLVDHYLKTYLKKSGLTIKDVEAWTAIVAAARRYENIDGEQKALVVRINQSLQRKAV